MAPPLPAKEATLFKAIVKHYELKSYKKGLRAADQVLKKFPEHGETIAMKGLLLNCMEKKEEAYELVRKGIKLDIKSQVCWHVYGLLYRSDREYAQAIKCYRGALRHEPENVKILRDLSMLQIQLRLLPGFLETRQKLLTMKPTNRMHWFTFAVALHLVGRYDEAVGVVEAYERTVEGTDEPTKEPYEYSEMLLYKNTLIEEAGQPRKALDDLDAIKGKVADRTGWRERRAALLLAVGRHGEAGEEYLTLLARNPEHFGWHAGLQAAELQTATPTERWLSAEVTAESEATLAALYSKLQKAYPKSQACMRLPLDFTRSPPAFAAALDAYARSYVRKGVPSLFADLKPLCAEGAWSRALFGEIVAGWVAALEATGTFPDTSEKEPPSTLMWARVLLAQYHDCCGDTAAALSQLDIAIDHTPTCLDLYLVKARVYKHAGHASAAARWMEEARKMDLADRYLNTKATRYLLRADCVPEAEATIALFTKDGGSTLHEMQCVWFELELAASYLRTGDYGRALKNFTHVEKHFADIVEDQFDFHTYCVRKMTLREYVKMVRFEDTLYGHAFYVTAACGIVDTYLRIVTQPARDAAAAAAEEAGGGLSVQERKKAESKRRKAEAKAKAEAQAQAKRDADAKGKDGKGGKKGGGKEKPPDDDPYGEALASVEEPLAKAAGYMRTLLLHAPTELRVQVLACQLAMARSKPLLALRALRKALSLGAADAQVHRSAARFLHLYRAGGAALAPAVATVVERHSAQILAAAGLPTGATAEAYNDAFLARAGGGAAAAAVAHAEVRALVAPAQAAAAREALASLDLQQASLVVCKEALSLLEPGGALADAAAAAAFRQKAVTRFPHAPAFGGGSGDEPPPPPSGE